MACSVSMWSVLSGAGTKQRSGALGDEPQDLQSDRGRFLTGFGEVQSRTRDLELRPYLLGQATATERVITGTGTDSVVEAGDHTGKAGVDAKLGISPTLTADLTINTDFAQVEEDRQIINLTHFPVFFPEKREFFLESSGTFDFARQPILTPFYLPTDRLEGRKTGCNSRRRAPHWTGRPMEPRPAQLLGPAGRMMPTMPYCVSSMIFSSEHTSGVSRRSARVPASPAQRPAVASTSTSLSSCTVENLDRQFWITGTSTPGIPGVPLAWRAATDYPNDLFDVFASLWRVQAGYSRTLGFVRRTGIKETIGHLDFTPRPGVLGIRQLDFALPDWDIIANEQGSLTREQRLADG